MQTIRFGTDGVRESAGKWPIDLAGAQRIGLGVGKFLMQAEAKPSVIIGRDTRISGDMLAAALSAGLLAYGVDVVDVGVITTAGVAYLARQHHFSMGVVISASHNPWTENGIKLVGPDGFKLSDELEARVEAAINSAGPAETQEFGFLTRDARLVEDYIQYLIAPFAADAFKKLRLVMDCSNGAASAIAPRCFAALGSQVVVLNDRPTGMNINWQGGSEEVRAGRSELAARVREEKAHFGVAFDGDADRAVFVSEKGALVDGDFVLYAIGKYLRRNGLLSGDCVVTTEMANAGLGQALDREGIRTVYTKVGDKYVVRELLQNGYRLGGEQSGHIVILDETHTTGDGIYTALFLARVLLARPDLSLSAETEGMVKLPQVIASARVSSKPSLDQLDAYRQELSRVFEELGDRVIVNTRYSGTEPLLRVMIQGEPHQSLENLARLAIRLCRSVQSHTGDPHGSLDVKDCTTGAEINASPQ